MKMFKNFSWNLISQIKILQTWLFHKNKAKIITRVVNGRGESASPCVTSTDIIWKGWFSSTTVALVVDPTMNVVCSPGKTKITRNSN
jgi:hypothetical protein